MNTLPRRLPAGLALLAAAIVGFSLAKWTTQPSDAPRTPIAQSTAVPTDVNVDPSHLTAVGIELETATAGDLSTEIRAPGVVESAPGALSIVTARVSGTMVSIEKQLGDPVRVGDILARVDSRDAAAIAAERDVAVAKAALARTALEREQQLFDEHVTPRQDLENARTQLSVSESEERRAKTAAINAHVAPDGRSIEIVSPIEGRISSADAQLGSFVQSDTELFRISDPNRIQIVAAVAPADAARITQGDPAVTICETGNTKPAVVRSVTAAVSEQTRSATVVLTLTDGPPPGSSVSVVISPKAAATKGIVLHEDAVQRIEGRDVVFVRTAKGFRLQPVVIGARAAGRVMVISGLQAGETIAARNAFFLKAEMGKGAEEDDE